MAPLSYSMNGAIAATGFSRSYLERAIRSGKLRAKKSTQTEDGEPTGSWVILHSDLEDYLNGLVDA